MLNRLKELNRHLNFIDPKGDGFSRYGRFLNSAGWTGLIKEADRLIAGDEEPAYIASVPELESLSSPEVVGTTYSPEEVQVGICRGFNDTLNGMEWHDCPELIVAVTPLLLILGLDDEIEKGQWNSCHARICFLKAGEAVLLNEGTLHFAPCRSGSEPFLSLIILPRGVNQELDVKKHDPADKLLWKERKWILTHPDSPQAVKGAPIGISGANLRINILE